MNSTTSASDLRAELARRRVHVYQVAAEAEVHPSRLSRLLHERLSLTPEMAERIHRAIEVVAGERRSPRG